MSWTFWYFAECFFESEIKLIVLFYFYFIFFYHSNNFIIVLLEQLSDTEINKRPKQHKSPCLYSVMHID